MVQQKLHLFHLNVFHLSQKLPDLCVFLDDKSEPYHLFGLTETRLSSNISDVSVSIPNYTVVRRDSSRFRETGVAVYIHTSIQGIACRRSDLETDEVECIWIELRSPKQPSLFVGFLYRNPAATFEWYDEFLQMYDKVYEHNRNILLMGDFNIDVLKPHPAWESTTSALGLKQLVTAPTRVTASSATLIDHIYSNNPATVTDVQVNSLAISDHFPTSCTWSSKLPRLKKGGHTCITFRSLKRFNENEFLADLDIASFDAVFNETNPDNALLAWYNIFLPILDKHAPKRQKRVKNTASPAWLTKEIKDAMEVRNEFRRQKLFPEFKRARNHVKSLVRQAKKSFIDNIIQNERDVSTLWRAIAVVTGGSRQKARGIPSHLGANEFNEHFLSVADSLAPAQNDSSPYTCSEELLHFCREKTMGSKPFTIPPIAVYEVGKYISLMQNKKAAGPDEISVKMLKISLPYIVDSLTYIYNLCIQQNKFPSSLKNAKVIPIPKTKDMSQVNNYRPISLVSVLCKPLERHIHKHLSSHLESHQLLYPLQSGFRQKHSCHTAVARITDAWLTAMNNSEVAGSVFVDLQKAFDLVDHEILLDKLTLYLGEDSVPQANSTTNSSNTVSVRSGASHHTQPSAVSSFFRSYLSDRKQFVSVHGTSSSQGTVRRGVPQGSVLGPLLFLLFINDLPFHIQDGAVTCDLFADDATLHTPDKDIDSVNGRLQQSLNDISDWCQQNSMVINPVKTECMVVATRQKHQLKPLTLNLSIKNQPIAQVTEHKLLGVTIDNQLKWESHITRVCKAVSRNLFLLSKLKPYVDANSRLMFYNAHIKSHIDYASTVWDGSSDVHLQRLDSLHRRAAKLILPNPNLSTDQKLQELKLLPLRQHFCFNKGSVMFKISNDALPDYLCELFSKSKSRYSTHRQRFIVPKPRIDIYKTSLSFSGSVLWNKLPSSITNASSLSVFKESLLKFLLRPP